MRDTIINKIDKKIKEQNISFKLDNIHMDTIALDISRIIDKKCTDAINLIKKQKSIKINSIKKEEIRKFFLGYPIIIEDTLINFKPTITNNDIMNAYKLISEGFEKKENMMIESILSRIKKKTLLRNQKLILKKNT